MARRGRQVASNLTYVLLILLFLSSPAFADWVHGEFSDRANLDSLERILVIRDVDSQHVFGDRIVSLGDVNADGTSDIVVCRLESSIYVDNLAYLFLGSLNPDGVFDAVYTDLKPQLTTAGDVNDDGYVDLGMVLLPTKDFGFFWGGPGFDDVPDFVIPERYSPVSAAMDLDGDGNLDYALSNYLDDSSVFIYRIDGARDTTPEHKIHGHSIDYGDNMATCDINGDGWADLLVTGGVNSDSSYVDIYFGGPSFDTLPDLTIASPERKFGNHIVPLGDFNGDGYGDVFISGTTNLPYGIYFGGPDMDDTLDVILNAPRSGGFHFMPVSVELAGDVNNDGLPDLILGEMVPVAYYYAFHVYLGGPIEDTVLYADIYVTNTMTPVPCAYLGAEVAGIGDFNGDGLDDFAVRSQTASGGSGWYAEVNIFSGWDPAATDVEYDYEPTIPNGYDLPQNYPNPFNPSTTIQFALPIAGQTSLTIYNVLGEKVKTLIDKPLPAGSYHVEWDGTDKFGNDCASGVYLYRLIASDQTLSKKMVLLR